MERASLGRWALVVAGYTGFFVVFFAPVLFDGRFLAFGDGRTQWLPMYFGPHRLWEPNLMLGYPQFANPEQFWYPLALLRAVPGSFNAFVVSAYVIAACGAYGLVRYETGSNLGGIVGGLTYALSGFMISHLQHLDIVHPAAWAPYFFWAVRALRHEFTAARFAGGALALALCVLGGQPQIFVYTAVIGIVLGFPRVLTALACAGVALALAAIVLIPGAELASHSVRATMPFYQFAPGVPLAHVPVRLFFPNLLPGLDPFTEQSDYAGILTLVLALAAARALFAAGAVRLWAALAAVALLLTTGNELGIASLTFHLPILNLFRSQGRHAFEFALAAGVLAGFAIAALESGTMRGRDLARAAVTVAIAMAFALGLAWSAGTFSLDRFAAELGAFANLVIDPRANGAVALPLAVFVLACAALAWFARRPRDAAARAALVAACALDLSSFAWFGYWHWGALPRSALDPPPYAAALRASLAASGGREFLLDVPGDASGLRPNANLLWDIPSAWASFALLPERPATLLHSVRSDFFGVTNAAQLEDPADRSFDLAAIRYVVVPGGLPRARPYADPWDAGFDWDRRIGAAPNPAATAFSALRGRTATAIGIVSSLGLGAQIVDGTTVADVVVIDTAGRAIPLPLRAGRETAEFAYERFDVRPHVRHARAPVYASDGPNHRYAATLTLPRRTAVARIEVRWRYAADRDASLLIDKLALLDRPAGTAFPISPLFLLADDPARLRPVPAPGGDAILENLRAFPRVWTARRVVVTTAGDALDAIRAGTVDFATTALVEGAAPFEEDAGGTARTVDAGDARIAVEADCPKRCFVVASDPVYPGWTARVDGRAAPLYAADYALRGVAVPPGRHRVEFVFAPLSLVLGAAISATAAVALLAALFQRRSRA